MNESKNTKSFVQMTIRSLMTAIIAFGYGFDENSNAFAGIVSHETILIMKTENAKRIESEAAYLVFLGITLVVLSGLTFPLLLAMLPVAILVVCREFWRVERLRNKRHQAM